MVGDNINKHKYLYLLIFPLFIFVLTICLAFSEPKELSSNTLNATVISSDSSTITVRDANDLIYTFNATDSTYGVGEDLIIEYTGLLNKNKDLQDSSIINILPVSQDEEDSSKTSVKNLFSQFDTLATNKLKEMTLDEKIGQILLVRYNATDHEEALNTYKVGGFIFFEDAFQDKTKSEVQNMISNLQKNSHIPLLTATDEEGGSVVRISNNKNLAPNKFLSPRELYLEGGFPLIKTDTENKSELLSLLGLNINLAPVIDVSTNSSDYIYNRSLGEEKDLTSIYAKTVIEASKGYNVSYVLKHFPGYGNNEDTHQGKVIDDRSLADLKENDIPPFESGIASGAEAILVSHNIVKSIDADNPASLSASMHNFLRNDLNFTGIIMTDDLSMQALSSIEKPATKALLAGNDIIITTNYKESFEDIKQSLEEKKLSESLIDTTVHKILTWKYAKGLMYEYQK